MSEIDRLYQQNRDWAGAMTVQDPAYFSKLESQQDPEYLWIGCSDSRVPANQIVGLAPGEVFVHRNVANVVAHSDLNCLTVLHYAINVLRVRDILVVGHYGCGGVRAAFEERDNGLIDNWLRGIKDIHYLYREELEAMPDDDARVNRLCELNVLVQVANVCHTTIVQNAWERGQRVEVHGMIYSLHDGLLQRLGTPVSSQAGIPPEYRVRSL